MVLAVDIGSSSLKAALIATHGLVAGPVRMALPLLSENIISPFPRVWYKAFLAALESFSDKLNQVESVSISGHGPTMVPVDRDGNPVGGIIPWNHQESSHFFKGSYFIPKALWFREKRSVLFEKVDKILFCPEYLAWSLCGRQKMALPNERFVPFFWNREQLSECGLSDDLFPEYQALDQSWGGLRQDAARETGLKEGIPVFCGGTDYLMALLGAACTEPGMCCNRTGSSEGINYCSDNGKAGSGLRNLPHFNPAYHHVSVVLNEAGSFLRSFSDLIPSSSGLFESGPELRRFLEGIMTGGTEFYQQHRDELPSKVWFNLGCLRLALLFRDGVSLLEKSGCPVVQIQVTGGLAYLPELNRLKSFLTGKTLEIPSIIDAELAGDAALALAGTGSFSSPKTAAEALYSVYEIIKPDSSFPDPFLALIDGL